jgi:hypothetical protein
VPLAAGLKVFDGTVKRSIRSSLLLVWYKPLFFNLNAINIIICHQVILIATNVTVEPAVFVLELASKMDEVAIKDMLLYKTCINDFNETDAICNDLLNETNYDLNEAVQNEVLDFIITMVIKSDFTLSITVRSVPNL